MELKSKLSAMNGWQRLVLSLAFLWFILTALIILLLGHEALLQAIGFILILNIPSILIASLLIWSIEGFKKKPSQ